jgi:putative oxidoreductase
MTDEYSCPVCGRSFVDAHTFVHDSAGGSMELQHLIGRIIFGGYFLYHALNHLFLGTDWLTAWARREGVPLPRAAVYLTGLLLLLGSLSMLLGVAPTWGVLLLILFMVPVSYKLDAFWDEEGEERVRVYRSFIKNMALVGALLMFLAIPEPWPYSLGS